MIEKLSKQERLLTGRKFRVTTHKEVRLFKNKRKAREYLQTKD